MMGPMGTRLGVLAGELWLVAGEDTGDDSLLSEDPARKRYRYRASAGATLTCHISTWPWTQRPLSVWLTVRSPHYRDP